MKNYENILHLEENLIKMEKAVEELNLNCCIRCGEHVDKEILELDNK